MGSPALQALTGERKTRLEIRVGQGPAALGSAQTIAALPFTAAGRGREPLGPVEPPRAQGANCASSWLHRTGRWPPCN